MIVLSVTIILLVAYVIYTFPQNIRQMAGIQSEVKLIYITMEVWDPEKGLENSTTPMEYIVRTADPARISEILAIFDDYRYRKKLDHRVGGDYEKTTYLSIGIWGSKNDGQLLYLNSHGTLCICRKGGNDYYHIGLMGNEKTVELYSRLIEYAKRHPYLYSTTLRMTPNQTPQDFKE